MTVSSQVQQALAGLKSAQASFETFSLQTENQAAKQLYKNAAQQCQMVVDSVQARMNEIKQEEPQYDK